MQAANPLPVGKLLLDIQAFFIVPEADEEVTHHLSASFIGSDRRNDKASGFEACQDPFGLWNTKSLIVLDP